MKKLLLILFSVFFSCNNKGDLTLIYNGDILIERYYLKNKKINGHYEEFYINGNLKSLYIYDNGVKTDSSIHYFENYKGAIKSVVYWKKNTAYYQKEFFENGKLMSQGMLLKEGFKIGKWEMYNKKGYLFESIEYVNIKGKQYPNQVWKFNEKGDTIIGGIYYELIKKDTIEINEPYRVHIFLKQRLLLNSESFVYIPEEKYVALKDFSNEDEIKWNKIDNVSRWHNDFPDRKHDVIFSIWAKKKGWDTLRGYLIEKEVMKNDVYDSITRKTYFNIPYFVR